MRASVSFEELYNQYFAKVYRFFMKKTGDDQASKDLSQEVFIKVYNNWEKVSNAKNTSAYLFKVSSNLLIDHLQKSAKEARLYDEISEVIRSEANTLQKPEEVDQKLIEKVEAIFNALPEKRQTIFRLRKLQNLSTKEVSEELGISARTVENQLYRTINLLREKSSA